MAKKSIAKSTPGIGITPVGDRVLIKALSESELGSKTKSGIIIPDTIDKEKSEQGKVVAVGNGKLEDGVLVKPSVSVGDTVVFSWGREIKYGGEEYMLVKSEDILAILK